MRGTIRPGHHRPLGSTTRSRFVWNGDRLPELGDVACQVSAEGAGDEDLVRRAFRVVGFEEGRSRDRFRLVLERVEYGTVPASGDPEALWCFWNVPRPW